MFKFNPILACDSYKLAHRRMYPEDTEVVYSNFTPRSNKYFNAPKYWSNNSIVVFGLTGLLKEMVESFKEGLFDRPLEDVLAEYREAVAPFCGVSSEEVEVEHLVELHNLGYLPIKVKALPEGTLCPMQVPMLTIRNKPGFYWITNYLETWLSTEGWKPCTSATLAYTLRGVLDYWADTTGGAKEFVQWQGHDFSMRGMSGVHDAARTGAGHLLSFTGSDTILAAQYLSKYYSAEGLVAASVPASEHSVMTMGGTEGEFDILDRILFDVHPSGVVSVVSDSYDFWSVMTEYALSRKDRILSRTPNGLGMAKVVFRPDSGDPVKILTGYRVCSVSSAKNLVEMMEANQEGYEAVFDQKTKQYYTFEEVDNGWTTEFDVFPLSQAEALGAVQCLWNIFGGTTTEKGFRVLHERVGLIYGDSITVDRANDICKRLADKGFASTNCVFGVGSYSYQMVSRDTFGLAMKATYGIVNGEGREIFKSPKTDPGKKSAKGLLRVVKESSGKLVLEDQQTPESEETGELRLVYDNGEFDKEWLASNTLNEIRSRLASQR